MDAVDRIVEQWALEMPSLPTRAMATFGRLYRAAAAAGDVMQSVYARFGITRGDFDVLATLCRSGAPYQCTPGTLSQTLMLTSAGMTGRLDRLEAAGLIRRSAAATDGRMRLVTLTRAGLTLIESAVAAGVEVQERLLGDLSDTARAHLDRILKELLTELDSARLAGPVEQT